MTNTADPVETGLLSPAPTQNEKSSVVNQQALPLYSEAIAVSRRKIDRAVVRIATVTQAREAIVDEQLTHERIEVERVSIGRVIETVPPVREEGDTTITPVVEELVVVERRLVLKEEVRLRKVRVTEQHRETVVVRERDAVITRIEAGACSGI